jgi:hypothetical protein
LVSYLAGHGWILNAWLLWALILGATGWRHPAVSLWPGLGPGRRLLAVVALLLLVLTFLPTPFIGQRLL